MLWKEGKGVPAEHDADDTRRENKTSILCGVVSRGDEMSIYRQLYYISKISWELRHLPIPQLIALITCACNWGRSIALSRKHL